MLKDSQNDNYIELQQYLSLVGHKIQILLRKIELLKRREYPTPHPAGLAEIMIRILVRSFDELRRLNRQIGERPSGDIADRAWLIHRFVIRFMSRWIEAVEHAKVATPMGGIIDSFDAICNQAQFGTCLVMYPTWNHNFSFEDVSQKLATIARNINAEERANVFAGTNHHYVIITYPRAEEDITLAHVLLAHEVGHYIDFVQKWSTEIIERPIFFEAQRSLPDEFTEIEGKIAFDIMQSVSTYWIREIVADTIATALLGPGYVLALGEFMFADPTLHSNAIDIHITHPPEKLRLELMAQFALDRQLEPILQANDYKLLSTKAKEVYKLVIKTLRSTIKHKNEDNSSVISIIDAEIDISQKVARWIYEQLIFVLQGVINDAKAKTMNAFKEPWVCTEKDVFHALILQDNIRHGFTPTKLPSSFEDTRVSFSAVMNSGWFYFLERKSNGDFSFFNYESSASRRPEQISEKYVSIHKLIAKAVESINFESNYLHQKGLNYQ